MILLMKTNEVMIMNDFNIAAKSQDEHNKFNFDLSARGIAYKAHLNQRRLSDRQQENSLNIYAITL